MKTSLQCWAQSLRSWWIRFSILDWLWRWVASKIKHDQSHITTVISLLSPKVNLNHGKSQKMWTSQMIKRRGAFLGKMREFLTTFPNHTPLPLFAGSDEKSRSGFPTWPLLFAVILVVLLNRVNLVQVRIGTEHFCNTTECSSKAFLVAFCVVWPKIRAPIRL